MMYQLVTLAHKPINLMFSITLCFACERQSCSSWRRKFMSIGKQKMLSGILRGSAILLLAFKTSDLFSLFIQEFNTVESFVLQ